MNTDLMKHLHIGSGEMPGGKNVLLLQRAHVKLGSPTFGDYLLLRAPAIMPIDHMETHAHVYDLMQKLILEKYF